jgi:5-methylcytosine-specific restriction endonuclease McrA
MCQYCSTRLRGAELTLDHVMPKVKGGRGTWENLVTCCKGCNKKKGKRTIKELGDIGMNLLRVPRKPTMYEIQKTARHFPPNFVHESWEAFLSSSD